MKRIRFFFFLAIVYCILGPVLLFLETHLSGKAALEQALPIALLSVFFFAYSLASLTVFHKLLRNNGKSLTTYYLQTSIMYDHLSRLRFPHTNKSAPLCY